MKKFAVISLILLFGAGCIFIPRFLSGKPSTDKAQLSVYAPDNTQKVKFIKSYGWDIDDTPYEKEIVLIPEVFNKVLNDYNDMLVKSGFDLTPFSGCEVTRFSYKLKNHTLDSQYARVNILIYKNRIIAADVSSTRLDGFMHAIDKKNFQKGHTQ